LITFKPHAYFVIDSETWNEAKVKARSKDEWATIYKFSEDQNSAFTHIFEPYTKMKQSIYGLMPWNLFFRELRKSRITFYKPVERLDREFLIPDNLIFWELFHEITGAKRQRYTAKLDSGHVIEGIPIDAFNTESNVFRHEAGAANVLLHALMKIFGDKYLNEEFKWLSKKSGIPASISYKRCTIFKREFQVKSVLGEEKNKYGETDYDYALVLNRLGPDALLLVDLTTALWRKGLLSYDEYLERWKETCFNVPIRGKNVFFIWHVAINKTENAFFNDPPPNPIHSNFGEMIAALSSGNSTNDFLVISKESDLSAYMGQKVVILKLFKTTPASKNVENELGMLLNDYERSLFYKACFVMLKWIIEQS
jgi:hypothetical protein